VKLRTFGGATEHDGPKGQYRAREPCDIMAPSIAAALAQSVERSKKGTFDVGLRQKLRIS
jgi:hypothetical protein